jgi:hypothetical protein
MRRGLLVAATVALGAVLVRLARRRRAGQATLPAAPAGNGDPAVELRRTLDTARATAEIGSAAGHAAPLEERRARVHAKAQEALELMRDQDGAV